MREQGGGAACPAAASRTCHVSPLCCHLLTLIWLFDSPSVSSTSRDDHNDHERLVRNAQTMSAVITSLKPTHNRSPGRGGGLSGSFTLELIGGRLCVQQMTQPAPGTAVCTARPLSPSRLPPLSSLGASHTSDPPHTPLARSQTIITQADAPVSGIAPIKVQTLK